jgi:CheY-like chemotaxis protein
MGAHGMITRRRTNPPRARDARETQAGVPNTSAVTRQAPTGDEHVPVLIVEDDEDLREMMAQLLTLEGFRAETAANGRAALEYLRGDDLPDLILLDLMMPIMDGWEFRRSQCEDPRLADLPVIVLTALEPPKSSDFDGATFLTKPLDFDRLLDLVRRYCRAT